MLKAAFISVMSPEEVLKISAKFKKLQPGSITFKQLVVKNCADKSLIICACFAPLKIKVSKQIRVERVKSDNRGYV